MRSHARLLKVLDKVENGPIMEEKDFDLLISKTIPELVKKYDINYDKEDAICMSDDLADRLFEAAMELNERIGIYCKSTHRRIMFTREEMLEALHWAPDEVTYGSGLDKVTVRSRVPEDTTPVVNVGSPFGVNLDEDLFSKVMQSYAQEMEIDTIFGGCYDTIYGYRPKTHSPWEILMTWQEIDDMKMAIKRANRPGMGVGTGANSVSEVGALTGTSFDGFSQNDWHLTCMISELKTDYAMLMRMTHEIKSGCIIHDFYNPIYGGLAGGTEGFSLIMTAGVLMLSVIYMSTTNSMAPAHPFYNSNTAPEMIWAMSAAQQAITRNTHILTCGLTSPSGGPLTECVLYESAAVATALTVSGASRIDGVRSAVGVVLNHCSGLEAKFNAECANASLGMSRKDANELIKEYQKEYVHLLGTLPIGKPFTEVYDLTSLRPTPEWQGMYQGVKDRLISMGVPLK
jgi:methylamine--corrinoid protein Co-methyltransferase